MLCQCPGCGGHDKWLEDNRRKFEDWLAAKQENPDNVISYPPAPIPETISVADVLKELHPASGENVHDFIARMRKVEGYSNA